MSWSDASREAQLLIDRLNLRNDEIQGTFIDLNVLFVDCQAEGRYRIMVFQAAARILAKRGANTNIADIIRGK